MIRFMKNLLMDEVKETTQGGGGYNEPKGTEPTPAPTAPTPEAQGDVDEFGYAIEKAPEAAPKQSADPDAKPEQTEKAKPEEGKSSAAGYGEDDPAPVKEKPAATDDKVKSTKEELGFELDLKDAEPSVAAKLTELAKTHKLSEEQAKALVNLKKTEIAESKASMEARKKEMDAEVAKLKASWHTELKSDKDFGGQNFGHSLKKIDKVLTEFLGETKKELTASGSMLPPYVMRDLLKLANHLYKTEGLVSGDAKVSDEPKHFLQDLYS